MIYESEEAAILAIFKVTGESIEAVRARIGPTVDPFSLNQAHLMTRALEAVRKELDKQRDIVTVLDKVNKGHRRKSSKEI